MTLNEAIMKASVFARLAHQGQTRKYNGEPYFEHVRRVAQRVAALTEDPALIQAAFLHDVIEDCGVTGEELSLFFQPRVVRIVKDLTDTEKGNRKTRKRLSAERIAAAMPEVQLIKVCDLIDNTHTIVENDPKFAKVYLEEKRVVLDLMHPNVKRMAIWREARSIVE